MVLQHSWEKLYILKSLNDILRISYYLESNHFDNVVNLLNRITIMMIDGMEIWI